MSWTYELYALMEGRENAGVPTEFGWKLPLRVMTCELRSTRPSKVAYSSFQRRTSLDCRQSVVAPPPHPRGSYVLFTPRYTPLPLPVDSTYNSGPAVSPPAKLSVFMK